MERKWNSQVHCISLLMIQNGSRLGFITTLMTRLVWKGRGVIWPSKTLQKGSTWLLLNLRTWNKQSHHHSFQSLVISFPQFLQVVILLFFYFFIFIFMTSRVILSEVNHCFKYNVLVNHWVWWISRRFSFLPQEILLLPFHNPRSLHLFEECIADFTELAGCIRLY